MTTPIHADGSAATEIRTLDHAEFGTLAAALIASRGGVRFRAHGRSMRPTIHSGDILTVEQADPEALRIGDIVMLRTAAGAVLVHRLIRRDGDTWTTCGDAIRTHDERVATDQLIGVVRTVEHHGITQRPARIRGRLMAAFSRYAKPLIRRRLHRIYTAHSA